MLETERLIIRPFTEDDIDDVFEMRSDPDLMRYIRAPQIERHQAQEWIKLITSRWEEDGIGFCALIGRENEEFVGWCGLWILKETNEIEIGYAIKRDLWGKGYATESARRILKYAFEDLGLSRVVGVAFPENSGSIGVMKKLGMKYVGIGSFYDGQLVQYAITSEEYR